MTSRRAVLYPLSYEGEGRQQDSLGDAPEGLAVGLQTG